MRYKALIIGASADSGFLNKLSMNSKISVWELFYLTLAFLVFYLPFYLLLSLLGVVFKKSKKIKSSIKIRKKLVIGHFCQTFFSKSNISIFREMADGFSKNNGTSVSFTEYSAAFYGFFNIDEKRITKLLKKERYDWIYIHLGGNDILSVADRFKMHKKIVFLAKSIKKHSPKSMVIYTGVHNMNFCFFNQKHLYENFLSLPFGKKISVAKLHKIAGFKNHLKSKIGNDHDIKNYIYNTSKFLKETFFKVFNEEGLITYYLKNRQDFENEYDVWRNRFSIDGFHPNLEGVKLIGQQNVQLLQKWHDDHVAKHLLINNFD